MFGGGSKERAAQWQAIDELREKHGSIDNILAHHLGACEERHKQIASALAQSTEDRRQGFLLVRQDLNEAKAKVEATNRRITGIIFGVGTMVIVTLLQAIGLLVHFIFPKLLGD